MSRTCDACRWEYCLSHVKHLEWWDYGDYIDGISNLQSTVDLSRRFLGSNLSQVLRMTWNLRHLSLVMLSPGPNPCLLGEIMRMRQLTSLHICFLKGSFFHEINIERMYPLFSQLYELYLSGNWYYFQSIDRPNAGVTKNWKMKRLYIQGQDICISGFCPNLKELVIRCSSGKVQFMSLKPVMVCSRLEKLEVLQSPNKGNFDDVATTLLSLCNLKSLTIFIGGMDVIDIMCPVSQMNGNVEEIPLPLLEQLVIVDVSLFIARFHLPSFCQAISRMLQRRKILKTFSVHGCPLDVGLIFSPIEGQSWSCLSLETLKLCFGSFVTRCSYSREEKYILWRTVYSQLSKLTKLRVLSIYSKEMDISLLSGVMAFAWDSLPIIGDTNCLDLSVPITEPKLTELVSLTIFSPSRSCWTKNEIYLLLSLFPNLKTLALKRLHPQSYLDIGQWLVELDRCDVSLGSIISF
jgi:hypothetical protein